jgi:hypothetical protein
VPFTALFLRARGFGVGEIGGTLAAMSLAGFLSGPWWGLAADRRLGHERALTLIAGGAVPLALLVWALPGGLPLAVACVALWAWKAPQTGIADAVALGRLGGRRAGYGSIRLWLSGGFAVMTIVWGALLQVGGAGLAPLAYASMLAVVALFSTRLMRSGRAEQREAEEPAGRADVRARRSLIALAVFLGSLFLLQAGYFAAQNFFALRIVDLGGGALLVGVGNALQAGVEVPVMAWTSARSNRRSPIALFAIGCVLWMVVFAGWAVLASVEGAVLVNILGGVAFALTAVSTVVIVDELVPLRLRATGQTLARAIGGGLAPVVGLAAGGLLYGAAGSGPMFAVTAASAGLAAVAASVVLIRAHR